MTAEKHKNAVSEVQRRPKCAIFPQVEKKWASLQTLEANFALSNPGLLG